MTRGTLIVALSGLVCVGCLALAPVEETTVIQPQLQPAPSPQEIVAVRQAAFTMSANSMSNIKATIANGGDPKSQAFAARGLARWAWALPPMFPQNTAAVTPSRARPQIWANKADFNARAVAFAAAAEQLAAAAQSGDRQAFAAGWRATEATCAACHDAYQAPQPPRG